MCERKLHFLLCRAAVLQQSHTGVSLIFHVLGQGQAASHILNKLLGPTVVLQSHPLRAIQQEDHIHWPLDAARHRRLWNGDQNVEV